MLRNCWGGVGMMTFFELAHMVDATQLLGWGGVGSGWWHSLNLNTWWMLRTHGGCYATAGVGWGGLGMMTFFELAQEARLANRRCRKRIQAWGSRRKDCMIRAVPRKKGSECGTGKGQGCSELVIYSYNRFTSIKLKFLDILVSTPSNRSVNYLPFTRTCLSRWNVLDCSVAFVSGGPVCPRIPGC